MRFRPCIDLRNGQVTQIVGSSLQDTEAEINFESPDRSAGWFSSLYRSSNLGGGHLIQLGGDNRAAVREALEEFPGGLQVGGGVNSENAREFLEQGASHVIVTSFVFRQGQVDFDRLSQLEDVVGKRNLVLDLSCRRKAGQQGFFVCTEKWQRFTDVKVDAEALETLSGYCDEFLVHGIDVEGKRQGVDLDLVQLLATDCPRNFPLTYAGGVRSLADFGQVEAAGQGRIDLSVGSALDIFGGALEFQSVLQWHKDRNPTQQ